MFEKMKSYLLSNANQKNGKSISSKLRKKRLEFFSKFCEPLEKPIRILDLGGSDYHWRDSDFKDNNNYHVTIVNNEIQDTKDFRNFCFIKRDVRELKIFDDKDYDIVYSNSLLEHLNAFGEQKKLAEEIIRIGKHYFIQTPNYYFPVEPHFLFPFFQYLSDDMKTKLVLKYNLGWFKKAENESKAYELATSIRLLKKNELKEIFPDCRIYSEKYFLLNKSFIIYN